MTGSLTPDQMGSYWSNGYLFPLPLLTTDEAASCSERFDKLRMLAESLELGRPFADYARANLNLVSTAAAELARHPKILDAVEPLLGPDLLCWMVELIVKEPHTDTMLTVHQDLDCWGLDGADRQPSHRFGRTPRDLGSEQHAPSRPRGRCDL